MDYTIYTYFNEPSNLAFPTSNIGLRISRHACRLVVANVTFQYPAAPLRILQFLSMCYDYVPLFGGGLPLDVLSILEAAGHNVVMGLWGKHLVLSGCMFTGSDRSCVFVHVLLKPGIEIESVVQSWSLVDCQGVGKDEQVLFFSLFDHSLVVELVGARSLTAGLERSPNWLWRTSFRAFGSIVVSLGNIWIKNNFHYHDYEIQFSSKRFSKLTFDWLAAQPTAN